MNYAYLDDNLRAVREKLSKATERSGRTADSVTLMAAVKSADIGEINYLTQTLGVRDIGENRVQQLLERYDVLINKEDLRIHFIGSLQTNKVKYIIDKVYLIHSLDSDRLAAEINKQAKKHGMKAKVLIEINSGNEESKGGIDPQDAPAFALSLAAYENIELCGFMTMAPKCENKNDYYGYFYRTRDLAYHIWQELLGRRDAPMLSMGMSGSYEEAAESGATVVRVGRTMFEKNNETT